MHFTLLSPCTVFLPSLANNYLSISSILSTVNIPSSLTPWLALSPTSPCHSSLLVHTCHIHTITHPTPITTSVSILLTVTVIFKVKRTAVTLKMTEWTLKTILRSILRVNDDCYKRATSRSDLADRKSNIKLLRETLLQEEVVPS